MPPTEEQRLRELYATWPVERLVRALHVERRDYTEEAVRCLQAELDRRGVPEENMTQIVQASRPRARQAPRGPDTLFRPWRLNRKQYAIRFLIWFGTCIGLAVISATLPEPWSTILFGCALVTVIYRVLGMDIPRLRSIGWSPWTMLLFLVPVLNLGLLGCLFFAPPGQHVDARVKEQRSDLVANAVVPDYALGAHTASLGLAFCDGADFPEKYRGGAFVGQHGSWNRKPLSGYKVIFIAFENGRPKGLPEDVLSGFVDEAGNAHGRPVGVAFTSKGALLVADDVGNVIWRVTPLEPAKVTANLR